MHFGDYTFIFLLALVLFGPKKMPEMGRQLGKLLAEFRRASNEFKFQIQEELRNMEEDERKKKLAESLALAEASQKAMIDAGATARAEAGPTILPPSTGEPVSTGRPFAVPVDPGGSPLPELPAPEAPGAIAGDANPSAASSTTGGPNGSAGADSEASNDLDSQLPVRGAAESVTHG